MSLAAIDFSNPTLCRSRLSRWTTASMAALTPRPALEPTRVRVMPGQCSRAVLKATSVSAWPFFSTKDATCRSASWPGSFRRLHECYGSDIDSQARDTDLARGTALLFQSLVRRVFPL